LSTSPEEPGRQLVLLTAACQALAEAKTIPEAKLLRDKAAAVQALLRQQGYAWEAQNHAAELKLRAERRLGELLVDMPRNRGGNPNLLHDETGSPPSYRELGIDRVEAHRWQTIATVPIDTFEQHIAAAKAAKRELTTAAVLRLAKKREQPSNHGDLPTTCTVDDLHRLVSAGHLFPTLYADPPWQYRNKSSRGAANHYRTMPIEEITALPVAQLAAPKSALFLWTTWAFLPEALRLVAAWGFDWKTGSVWCKPQLGLGNYFRKCTELLLLGTRGGLQFKCPIKGDWFVQSRGKKHSCKPERFRALIEMAVPGPRLELFGRHIADNWAVWGDQIQRTMFDADVARYGQTPDPPPTTEPTLFPS